MVRARVVNGASRWVSASPNQSQLQSSKQETENLGQGQYLKRDAYVAQAEQERGRARAGNLELLRLKADDKWLQVGVQQTKNDNTRTKGAIAKTEGVILQNELAYKKSVVPLHKQLRVQQLQLLSNAVKAVTYSVEVSTVDLSSQKVISEGVSKKVDFNFSFGDEEPELVNANLVDEHDILEATFDD